MRAFATSFALALAVAASAGCSSAGESEAEDVVDEGALVSQDRFLFRVNSPEEKSGVDYRNAYGAAVLAKLVYLHNEDAPMKAALREAGVPVESMFMFTAKKSGLDPRTNPIVNGTDGMYVKTRDAGFLVFRGSEHGVLKDVLTNIQGAAADSGPTLSLNRASKGSVHSGFSVGVKSVWKSQLRDQLARVHGENGRSKLPLYVIGHSLGGALGQIAMHHMLFDSCLSGIMSRLDVDSTCDQKYIPVTALYTFGAPRVGDQEFTNELWKRTQETKTRVFRFVGKTDGVTTLPRFLPIPVADYVVPPYRHFGLDGDERQFAVLLDKDGTVLNPITPPDHCESVVGRDSETALKNLVQCDPTVEEVASGIMSGSAPWKGEHPMSIYREKMRGLALIYTLPERDKDPKVSGVRQEIKTSLEKIRRELLQAAQTTTDTR